MHSLQCITYKAAALQAPCVKIYTTSTTMHIQSCSPSLSTSHDPDPASLTLNDSISRAQQVVWLTSCPWHLIQSRFFSDGTRPWSTPLKCIETCSLHCKSWVPFILTEPLGRSGMLLRCLWQLCIRAKLGIHFAMMDRHKRPGSSSGKDFTRWHKFPSFVSCPRNATPA